MTTDTMIRYEGMKYLCEKLGLVEAERFISLIHGENFEYTEWQRALWKEKSNDELFNAAGAHTASRNPHAIRTDSYIPGMSNMKSYNI